MPPPRRTAVGLVNRANDCFANANLQALAGCPSLYCYLHQLQFLCPEKESASLVLTKVLYSLIAQLNEPTYTAKSISIQPIVSAIEFIHRSHLSRSQHDAHEMLHLILETLQTEITGLAKHVASIPPFLFEGKTVDTIKCKVCGYERQAQGASFLVLTLTVPQKRYADLQALMNEFQAPDMISDYNCQKCRLLNHLKLNPDSEVRQYAEQYVEQHGEIPDDLALPPASSPIEKSTRIVEAPETLVVHLNRSIYSGGAQRNSCKVAIPEFLEIASEHHMRKYKLSSVVRHSGTHMMGHYECVRRKNLDFWKKQTHKFDESTSDLIPAAKSPNYSASLKSVQSLGSLASNTSEDSILPFPPPASAQASVQVVTGYAANSAPPSPRLQSVSGGKKSHGPKFWNISDTVVKENTSSQALGGSQSANYLVFYEKVKDTVI